MENKEKEEKVVQDVPVVTVEKAEVSNLPVSLQEWISTCQQLF